MPVNVLESLGLFEILNLALKTAILWQFYWVNTFDVLRKRHILKIKISTILRPPPRPVGSIEDTKVVYTRAMAKVNGELETNVKFFIALSLRSPRLRVKKPHRAGSLLRVLGV